MADIMRAGQVMRIPMGKRVYIVDDVTRQIQKFAPGLRPWSAITETLLFFDRAGWGKPYVNTDDPGDWIGIVDAYVLEALSVGVDMALKGAANRGGNPAAPLWCGYVLQLSGDPSWPVTHRQEHNRMWAEAEHVATEWGCARATDKGITRTEVQYRWYLMSAMYRSLMTDAPEWLRLGELGPVAWLSDVTKPEPVRVGSRVALALAEIDPVGVSAGVARAGVEYLRFVSSKVINTA